LGLIALNSNFDQTLFETLVTSLYFYCLRSLYLE